MPISINDPILSTKIFIIIFIFVILISIRRKKDSELFPLALTQELKGLAILAIVFSHMGYFLSNNHSFLFPLSIMAGVGVNLFLFLSGYGLTMSALKKNLSIINFYKKRLLKLFMPFWLVAFVFFVLDFFILHISYSWPYIIQSLLGIFPRADLFLDVNSPLWFLTLTLFYYLLFPLIFLKKSPWLTAILIYAASYFIIQLKLPVTIDVLHLYQLHLLAFPLGIAFASLFFEPYSFNRFVPDKIQSSLYNLKKPVWIKTILDRSKEPNIFRRSLKIINRPTYYAILIALLIFIGFMAYNSGVDGILDKEQKISLITMSAIILFFILKRFEIKLFHLFGLYAYEIYLIHWPLMSRYDIFFRWLPGWIAVILYLGLFLIIALIINKILHLIYRTK